MRKPIVLVAVMAVCAVAVLAIMWACPTSSGAAEEGNSSQLCVVWSSGDPGVAKDQFAELIQTYEGFQFDLKIVESSHELE